MKSKIYSLIVILVFIHVASLHAQTPSIKWWFNTQDASFGQSASADIDGDGKLEIVFGCYRNDSTIYALNAENGSLMWKFNAHGSSEGCNDVAPVIYDVDGDDSLDVIVASSCNPKTYCFNGKTGAIKWQLGTRGSDSPPTIADIDNDGKPEILHGEFGGYVVCINGENGTQAWEIAVDINSWIQTAPTIVDLNGDGQLDFVVATWNNVTLADNKVYAYNGADHTLLWSYPIGDFIYHGTAVADLDHDGKPELVLGSYNDTLYCINGEDGTTNWKYNHPSGFYVGAPATIADLNMDGWCEVVFSDWNIIGALSHDGHLLWDYTIPNYEQAFRGVALADISGDDSLDVIFGTDGGNVMALKGTSGSQLWSIDLRAHYGDTLYSIDNAPLVADFDGDDTLDVFIVGGHAEYPAFSNVYGRAYMLSVGKGSGPDWLMFQRDIRRQSSMCEEEPNAIKTIHSEEISWVDFYPNPVHDELNLQFNNPSHELHSLFIYDARGQLIHKEEQISDDEIHLPILSWQSGLYFFQLKSNNVMIGRGKFVVE